VREGAGRVRRPGQLARQPLGGLPRACRHPRSRSSALAGHICSHRPRFSVPATGPGDRRGWVGTAVAGIECALVAVNPLRASPREPHLRPRMHTRPAYARQGRPQGRGQPPIDPGRQATAAARVLTAGRFPLDLTRALPAHHSPLTEAGTLLARALIAAEALAPCAEGDTARRTWTRRSARPTSTLPRGSVWAVSDARGSSLASFSRPPRTSRCCRGRLGHSSPAGGGAWSSVRGGTTRARQGSLRDSASLRVLARPVGPSLDPPRLVTEGRWMVALFGGFRESDRDPRSRSSVLAGHIRSHWCRFPITATDVAGWERPLLGSSVRWWL